MSLYQDLILDHYRNPRNAGVLSDATHHGEAVNLSCGDKLKMDIRVSDGIIDAIGFVGVGCAISQASASILTEVIKGKTISEVVTLEPKAVLEILGLTLSPNRLKCALLSLETAKSTLAYPVTNK